MKCERCGSFDFNETDGFYFCAYCQTQSQGFAKEVADEEEFFVQKKEIFIKTKKVKEKTHSDKLSLWTSFEAYNEIFIIWIEQFFTILDKINIQVDKDKFKSIAMKIWFKYLKESEAVFTTNDHLNQIKLHPLANQRDRIQLHHLDDNSLETLPFLKFNAHNQKKRFLLPYSFGNLRMQKTSLDFIEQHKHFLEFKQNSRLKFNETAKANTKVRSKFFEVSKKEKKEEDVFASFVNEMILGKNVEETISLLRMEHQIKVMKSIKNEIEQDEILDRNDFDNIIKEQMPSKSKALLDVVSIKELKTCHRASSFLTVDFMSKSKLLACLFITIRLFNLNIFLSDLIRWSFEDSICYNNPLYCLPKHWEIRKSDYNKFRSYNSISYRCLVNIVENTLVHCRIDTSIFPKPDVFQLIKRFIKDLNLPKGLYIILYEKYGQFLNDQTIQLSACSLRLPFYDILAVAAIVITLRDLFDLFGSNGDNFVAFKKIGMDDLFIWSEWLHFSKLRLALIKIFCFDMHGQFANNNTMDFDDLLLNNQREINCLRNFDGITAKYQLKSNNFEHRFMLQNSFAHLFFDDQDYKWYNEISLMTLQPMAPTLFPLTERLKMISAKISSPRIKAIIDTNYRNKLITPYICTHANIHHRRSLLFNSNFTKVNSYDQDCSDSIKHLIELASISTRINIRNYLDIFKRFDKLVKRDKLK